MENGITERIASLVAYAEQNSQVFVFGDIVFTPAEALNAMLANYVQDMEMHAWSEDECIQEYKKCMADA